jgi:hypothetical protein
MKLNKLSITIGLFCSLLLLLAFIPKGDDPIDKLVAALQKWTDINPQEKVYLHMDKPYYALGDTIWFKGYITIGSRHQLSALSGALNVDLISEKDSIVRSLKLPITSGMVVGEFSLGDDLKEGSYRIRAYTQWMRNAGEDYFFDKTFTVGSLVSDNIVTKADYQYKDINNKPVLTALLNYTDDEGKALGGRDVKYQIVINNTVIGTRNVKTDALGSISISIENEHNVNLSGAYIRTVLQGSDKYPIVREFPIKAALYQSDVQFFPESGTLVNGVSSRVGFKATGVDGTGTVVKGKIVDDANNEVGEIESLHAGMGSFLLKPKAGKNYKAQISFADGTTKTIALPKAADDGFVLGVYQPNKDSILVRIGASAKQVAAAPSLSFIAQSSGETIVASPVKIARASTSIWLEKKLFPTGIAQFTIFNSAGEPLNERVAFVRSNDLMQLNLKTAKNSYKGKESVSIALEAKDSKGKGVPGNFSVAVIDQSKVPVDENVETTIFTNILLTSDLKGYIEKPNYYFTTISEDVDKALDNLMLTQGYRRFAWKEITTVIAKPMFEAESLLATISGRVTTLNNKPMANANVSLLSLKANVVIGKTTDAEGKFKFDGILLLDSVKFAIQAKTEKNSDHAKIFIDTLPRLKLSKNKNMGDVSTNINATLKAYIDNGKKLDDVYEKTGQLDKVQRLKEVRIRARKIKTDANITPQGMFKIPEESADKVITLDNSETLITLAMALQGRLQGISVQLDDHGQSFLQDMRDRTTHIGLIVDGRRITTSDEISEILDGSILPEDVAKVEVVSTNMTMVNFLGSPSVLILTKLGTSRKQYNPNITNISPKGFNKVREFYTPKYDNAANADKITDLRSTIYWNPRVKTDADGKTSLVFYNGDGPGSYKVIVEGINAAGELGRQVYTYTVQ